MDKNILLIGMMGVGKTAVGRNLAREIGWEFYDTDTAMEEVTGLKLRDIYTKYGEIRFRSEEALILQRLAGMQQTIISTGGSLPFTAAAEQLIKNSGYVVWLKANAETVQNRLRRKKHRLFLPKGSPEPDIAALVAERDKQFALLAEYTVQVENYDLDGVVAAIRRHMAL